ncbi:MAG: LysR family transcriptional activator of nhaA [Planctomycetota bacterium]|jgi:LysR family transcriptional activator of nhaA
MGPLNYHHLQYFWCVAHEGGIAAASRRLHVGRASISAQVKTLETSIGTALFERRGRHLDLTETGRLVLEYADTIFRTGEELADVLRGQASARTPALRVGLADVMMKLVAFRALEPLLAGGSGVRLRCIEGSSAALFGKLAVHELDLVLSDSSPPPGADIRVHTRILDESSVGLFAASALKRRLAPSFPDSLEGAPLLLPTRPSSLRRAVDSWMLDHDLHPAVVGEFDDSALLKVFAEEGHGAMPAPTSFADDLKRRYKLSQVGVLGALKVRAYATFPARKHSHPALEPLLARLGEGKRR